MSAVGHPGTRVTRIELEITMNDVAKVEQVTNPLEINKERLREWLACASGYGWFLEKFPQGGMFGDVYNALHADRRYQDGDWLIERVFSQLDTGMKTVQLVSITGADKAKIEQQVKDCGGKEGESATTGEGANAATTGNWANAATTGEGANAATSGEHAIAAALGIEGKAKAGVGGAIVLCYRNDEGHLIHVRAGKVGENGVKPDVWYSLDENGEFVESEE